MIQTSARLLALLSLLQLRREWTGPELADRLEVGPRTIRRDVEKLRSLGYPIEAAPGVAGGYRLGAGGELPPLLLDDAEAVAVTVGLRTAASGSISGIEETSVRALAKLEQVLPSRLRRRVSALGDATSAFGVDGPRIDAHLLATLAGACRDTTRLRFTYVARDDRSSQRHTEPSARSIAATAGTCSLSTSAATTGARSGSIASAAASVWASAGASEPFPAATPRRSSSSSCRPPEPMSPTPPPERSASGPAPRGSQSASPAATRSSSPTVRTAASSPPAAPGHATS